MPRVVALYRYPVKGFTPETRDALAILPEGRVAGDRVLGFRFATCKAPDEEWTRKHEFVALVNTPGLARLKLEFDHAARRLRITHGGAVLADDAIDGEGRSRLAETVARFVCTLDENPLSRRPERLPLRLVGDGVTPRYQDNEAGQITLHSRASLASVATAVGDSRLSELRFRSNIVIDSVDPWEEQSWVGRKLRIGNVRFDVVRPKVRCLATHANPETGERDLPILPTLKNVFAQQEPTFAVALMPSGEGGIVRVGDEVSLAETNMTMPA
jgi:uncharacterized protein YcbX